MTPDFEAVIVGMTPYGTELRGTVVRWTATSVFFSSPSTGNNLKPLDVVDDFRVHNKGKIVYSGRPAVKNVVNIGPNYVCEVEIENGWSGMDFLTSFEPQVEIRENAHQLIQHWREDHDISPEFKAVIVDLHSFLSDLRLWLDGVEVSVAQAPENERLDTERRVLEEVGPSAATALDNLIESFEFLAARLPAESRPVHRKLLRRYLHPLVLCAPFAYRSYYKPLGYAGDYGMVNMILGDVYRGETLFAKVVNGWLLRQAPAVAHRNRLATLLQKLREETVRVSTTGRLARIYSLGCGPAGEVQKFLSEREFPTQVRFTLVDFNEETLQFTRDALQTIHAKHRCNVAFDVVKKSVHHILKESLEAASTTSKSPEHYDFVYCAGLFDYLTDPTCRRLMSIFYSWLAPGGLLLVTNVDATLNDSRAFKHSLDYILDWHLIYRTSAQLRTLVPHEVQPESCTITADQTGVNAFLEVRKPLHG